LRTVLILGGCGAFGSRLARRLSTDGWAVLVAGRDLNKASVLAATLPHARPLFADRERDLSLILQEQKPFLVIDAAGPFQGSRYLVAEACIANGVHYVDLADAREFVAGMTMLDKKARDAAVAVITGASSVPALSGAVIADLTEEMEDVRAVSMAISASNRATAGASISAAIFSYVGKPVRLWLGRRWVSRTGWQLLRRERYSVAGHRPINRLVALSDVPDHDIIPDTIKGRPATIFRAGPEFSFQLLMVWALGWLVRWGWVGSLQPFSKWLFPLQKLTAGFGSDRSAMMIEAKGTTSGGGLVRRWTLIAKNGDGPEIPTIAAHLIANALADDRISTGARTSVGLMSLADFNEQFESLAIIHETTTRTYMPVFKRVMGDAFDQLPQPVRRLHNVIGDGGAEGMATVTRGASALARMVASIMGFPPEGHLPLYVRFEEDHGIELWTRNFDGHVFTSELSQSGEMLVERFGPMRFHFDLPCDTSGLTMVMKRWSVLHVPMPMFLAPRSAAKEWGEGDDFCFDVPISLPFIGPVVHYVGRLRIL
jgi:Domain of unknown function (DUF4166)/Saccharopine dehydrogenase NADP binding domain